VLTVAAQTSTAPTNTTVTNNLTVALGSISLGSTLHATGEVVAGGETVGKRVHNAPHGRREIGVLPNERERRLFLRGSPSVCTIFWRHL
jgi:hypothetical protein